MCSYLMKNINITTQEVISNFKVTRPWLWYMVKAGKIHVIQKVEEGRTKNYYSREEISIVAEEFKRRKNKVAS